MPTHSTGMSAAFGMIFLILGVSVVIPGVIVNLESPQQRSFDQDVNERVVITGDVSSRVTQISNQQEVNVSMFDRKTGEFNSTGQLSPGENTTIRLDGENITVTLTDVFGQETAVVEYVYPLYVGWPDGADLVVKESPLIILLSAVIMLIGLLFTIQDGVV